MSNVLVRPFAAGDPAELHVRFAEIGWDKPVSLFERYLAEHVALTRYAVVAEVDGDIVGYVTLMWGSAYPFFAEQEIPEISDLNVLPLHRRGGTANLLLDHIEHVAGQRSALIGLGVGLYADYGPAQRIYVRRGYLPDGRGLMYANHPIPAGEIVMLDDDATLMFVKQLDSPM